MLFLELLFETPSFSSLLSSFVIALQRYALPKVLRGIPAGGCTKLLNLSSKHTLPQGSSSRFSAPVCVGVEEQRLIDLERRPGHTHVTDKQLHGVNAPTSCVSCILNYLRRVLHRRLLVYVM